MPGSSGRPGHVNGLEVLGASARWDGPRAPRPVPVTRSLKCRAIAEPSGNEASADRPRAARPGTSSSRSWGLEVRVRATAGLGQALPDRRPARQRAQPRQSYPGFRDHPARFSRGRLAMRRAE
jgi:hypothetical protein